MSRILRVLFAAAVVGAPLGFAGCEVKVDDDADVVAPVPVDPAPGGKLDVVVFVVRK
jgi:hypothetical protein